MPSSGRKVAPSSTRLVQHLAMASASSHYLPVSTLLCICMSATLLLVCTRPCSACCSSHVPRPAVRTSSASKKSCRPFPQPPPPLSLDQKAYPSNTNISVDGSSDTAIILAPHLKQFHSPPAKIAKNNHLRAFLVFFCQVKDRCQSCSCSCVSGNCTFASRATTQKSNEHSVWSQQNR